MEITFNSKEIEATGDGMTDVSINYESMVETGIIWIDTLCNANLTVKVQSKMREIMRSDLSDDDKQAKLTELETAEPESLLGSSVSFSRIEIDNILSGIFTKTLPSSDTLILAFASKVFTSRDEFLKATELVSIERKKRKKASKK